MKDINKTLEFIRAEESRFDGALASVAKLVTSDAEKRFVLITGGSCAGKTTSTRKLSEMISAFGRACHTVSLDDFYRSLDESVYLPDGTRDVETINSLRVDIINETMARISACEPTPVPFFDFTTRMRVDGHSVLSVKPGDIVIIEGLHALNPAIMPPGVPDNAFFRIYLHTDSGDGSEPRFIRRLVRDTRYRAVDALYTFSLWNNVRANEVDSIEPFAPTADVSINTYFAYEPGILHDDAVAQLETVPRGSPFRRRARRLIKILSGTEPIDDSLVPANSLLREFI